MVGNIVFHEVDKLVMCKLSNLPTQNSVQELLRSFVNSDCAEVCVLLANMSETSSKTINHIRIMIEEEELKAQDQFCKLFVLLLHFPPAQFFQHCYPVLFLKGWDHTYLDTIAHCHATMKEVVDIQDWFSRCCFSSDELDPDLPDTLLEVLFQLLPQAISVISSRVYFGSKKDGSFNSSMDAVQRSEALSTLLLHRDIGNVLCSKFRVYWKPKVMLEYLERAANFSKQRQSTLNITDSIHTQFKSLFENFCIFVLTDINKDYNLDIIFDKKCPTSLHNLFLDIFKILPVPDLSRLNLLINNLPEIQYPSHSFHFPFFRLIYNCMEEQLELSGEAANLQLDALVIKRQESLVDLISVPSSKGQLQALIEAVVSDLKPQVK